VKRCLGVVALSLALLLALGGVVAAGSAGNSTVVMSNVSSSYPDARGKINFVQPAGKVDFVEVVIVEGLEPNTAYTVWSTVAIELGGSYLELFTFPAGQIVTDAEGSGAWSYVAKGCTYWILDMFALEAAWLRIGATITDYGTTDPILTGSFEVFIDPWVDPWDE